MKTIFIIIVFLFHFFIPLKSNDISINNGDDYMLLDEYVGEFYVDLGTAKKQISNDILLHVNAKVYRIKINSTSQKSFKSFEYDKNVYRYNVVCVSNSEYYGELTSTWIYGLWVKVNGVPITQPLYPRGKDLLVYTTPTIVHYIETDEEYPSFKLGWSESVPEPKIIR